MATIKHINSAQNNFQDIAYISITTKLGFISSLKYPLTIFILLYSMHSCVYISYLNIHRSFKQWKLPWWISNWPILVVLVPVDRVKMEPLLYPFFEHHLRTLWLHLLLLTINKSSSEESYLSSSLLSRHHSNTSSIFLSGDSILFPIILNSFDNL